jgi:hypothetical protein
MSIRRHTQRSTVSINNRVNSASVKTILSIPSVTVDYLVVAGGGAGDSGGGGAGGLIYVESASLIIGNTYNVTVGAGGTTGADTATNGNNSVFDSLTAIGGGAARYSLNGVPGGSGGGAAYGGKTGGAGTVGQGNAGGNSNPAWNTGAGGGGAGAVGGNSASAPTGGAGGIGLQYNISGTSTYYAGGGGGGTATGGTGGAGGNGGGGAGASTGATSGTVNTGGGGGGIYQSYPAGAGGSGVVILRFLSSVTVTATTGSPTITTDGSYKVYKFTSSGSITF